MKRKLKSMLAVSLVAALLLPTLSLKNNTNSKCHSTGKSVFFSIDPNSEE